MWCLHLVLFEGINVSLNIINTEPTSSTPSLKIITNLLFDRDIVKFSKFFFRWNLTHRTHKSLGINEIIPL